MKERFELYEFQGQKVLFKGAPIHYWNESVPEGLEKYEIRQRDENCERFQLARSFRVSYYGTLFAYEPIKLPWDGYLNFDEDTVFIDLGEVMTFEEYQEMMQLESQQVAMEMAP